MSNDRGRDDDPEADVGPDSPPDGHTGDDSHQHTPQDGGQAGAPGGSATETKYCVECGASINAKAEICPECGVRQPGTSSSTADDARVVAAVLAIVLGGFGAHKFYLGETGMGILYLCFFWTFIPSIVGIIEGAIYLSKSDEEFRAQYLE